MYRIGFAIGLLALLTAASSGQDDQKRAERAQLQADLRALEKYFTQDLRDAPLGPDQNPPKAQDVIKRIKQLPEGDDLRREAINLARRHARVKDMAARDKVSVVHHYQAHHRLYYSWTLLLELGVLHPGMTLEEAVVILGPANRLNGDYTSWYYSSSMHVNPALNALVKDGRIRTIRRDGA